MPEEQEQRKGPPPNFSFEYRHILHVAPQSQYATEDDFKAAVIAKYKALDEKAALEPKPIIGPERELEKRIAELETLLNAQKEKLDDVLYEKHKRTKALLDAERLSKQEPAPSPETPASTGKGECPRCGKFFKRLDMHVCPEPEPVEF